MTFLLTWAISALAIIISAYLLPGVFVDSVFAAFVTALVLGLVNAVLRPILLLLTLPVTLLTLGFFALVINAVLILLTTRLVFGFGVESFWWALLFSVVLSVINSLLSQIKNNSQKL